MPHPLETDSSPKLKGNPAKPLERVPPKSSSSSHLVARIPKKRIDAYQKEYENATSASTKEHSDSESKDKDNTSSYDIIKTNSPETKTLSNSNASKLTSDFDPFPSSAMNVYGTEFSYNFAKPVVESTYVTKPPSASSSLNFMDMDNNSITTIDENKKHDSDKQSNKTGSGVGADPYDLIPPSPLSNARHSHLAPLAQVSALRASSIVMPASPRTPVAKPGAAGKRDKKDTGFTSSAAALGKDGATEHKQKTADVVTDTSASGSLLSGDSCRSEADMMPPPPQIPPTSTDKQQPPAMDTSSDGVGSKPGDDGMAGPETYNPDYMNEELFSPPSILPPDSVNQEHDHSPTMPGL